MCIRDRFQVLLMARAAALALPEVVIALHHGARTFNPIRRFTLLMTGIVTVAFVAFVMTCLLYTSRCV